jgi:hypothetical protein
LYQDFAGKFISSRSARRGQVAVTLKKSAWKADTFNLETWDANRGTTLQSLYNFPLQRPAGSFCQPFAPGNWLNGFPRMLLSILAINWAKKQIILDDF